MRYTSCVTQSYWFTKRAETDLWKKYTLWNILTMSFRVAAGEHSHSAERIKRDFPKLGRGATRFSLKLPERTDNAGMRIQFVWEIEFQNRFYADTNVHDEQQLRIA